MFLIFFFSLFLLIFGYGSPYARILVQNGKASKVIKLKSFGVCEAALWERIEKYRNMAEDLKEADLEFLSEFDNWGNKFDNSKVAQIIVGWLQQGMKNAKSAEYGKKKLNNIFSTLAQGEGNDVLCSIYRGTQYPIFQSKKFPENLTQFIQKILIFGTGNTEMAENENKVILAFIFLGVKPSEFDKKKMFTTEELKAVAEEYNKDPLTKVYVHLEWKLKCPLAFFASRFNATHPYHLYFVLRGHNAYIAPRYHKSTQRFYVLSLNHALICQITAEMCKINQRKLAKNKIKRFFCGYVLFIPEVLYKVLAAFIKYTLYFKFIGLPQYLAHYEAVSLKPGLLCGETGDGTKKTGETGGGKGDRTADKLSNIHGIPMDSLERWESFINRKRMNEENIKLLDKFLEVSFYT